MCLTQSRGSHCCSQGQDKLNVIPLLLLCIPEWLWVMQWKGYSSSPKGHSLAILLKPKVCMLNQFPVGLRISSHSEISVSLFIWGKTEESLHWGHLDVRNIVFLLYLKFYFAVMCFSPSFYINFFFPSWKLELHESYMRTAHLLQY